MLADDSSRDHPIVTASLVKTERPFGGFLGFRPDLAHKTSRTGVHRKRQ
jgi:hypothetical protein